MSGALGFMPHPSLPHTYEVRRGGVHIGTVVKVEQHGKVLGWRWWTLAGKSDRIRWPSRRLAASALCDAVDEELAPGPGQG